MKISLIIGSFYPAISYGGPIYSTLNLSKAIVRLGIQVNVITTNADDKGNLDVQPNEFIKFEEGLFVKYYGRANRRSFSIPMMLNMWRDIKRSDLVYLQPVFSSYVPIALFYAKLFKKPVLLSARGSLLGGSLKSGSRFKKAWLKLFIEPFKDSISWHTTSHQEAEEIRLLYKNSNIFYIPNGVNIREFETSSEMDTREYIKKFTKREIDCKEIIVSMGRLHKVKGFDILIDAFRLIIDRFPKAVLLIAGNDAGEKAFLLKKIEYLNIKDRVFLIGQINGKDKIDFLSNADLFVLPSHNESFGVVFAEALAAGIPVVASLGTPWNEVVNYNCGYWVENSPPIISQAVISALSGDHKKMGINGKKYISEKYDWDNIAKEFQKTFNSLITSKA